MSDEPIQTKRGKSLVVVLTLITTVFVALLSGLQVDAGIRANNANRDSQYYATLTSNELVRQGYQSTYDFQTFTIALKAYQESLMFEYTSLGLKREGDQAGAENFHIQSQIAQARADVAQNFSIFYTDPRYAPEQPGGMPKGDIYIADNAEIANKMVVKQNAAADAYQKWNKKSDAYAAVLTLLAIIFFLLGVAQSTERMRPFFVISASVVLLMSIAWTFFIMIG